MCVLLCLAFLEGLLVSSKVLNPKAILRYQENHWLWPLAFGMRNSPSGHPGFGPAVANAMAKGRAGGQRISELPARSVAGPSAQNLLKRGVHGTDQKVPWTFKLPL